MILLCSETGAKLRHCVGPTQSMTTIDQLGRLKGHIVTPLPNIVTAFYYLSCSYFSTRSYLQFRIWIALMPTSSILTEQLCLSMSLSFFSAYFSLPPSFLLRPSSS